MILHVKIHMCTYYWSRTHFMKSLLHFYLFIFSVNKILSVNCDESPVKYSSVLQRWYEIQKFVFKTENMYKCKEAARMQIKENI